MKTTEDGLNFIDEETGLIIPIAPDMSAVMGNQITTQLPEPGVQGSSVSLVGLPLPESQQPAPLVPNTTLPEPLLAPLVKPPQPLIQPDPNYVSPTQQPVGAQSVTSTGAPAEGIKYDAVGNEAPKNTPFAVPSGAGTVTQETESSIPDFLTQKETQTSSSTQTTIYDPKREAGYEKSVNNYKTAQSAIGELMTKVNKDPDIMNQISKLGATSLSVQDYLDPDSDNFKRFTEQVTNAKNKINEAEKDLADFQKEAKVDPNKYVKNMSNTDKAITMLAVALEGVGAAMASRGGLKLPTGVIGQQLQDSINLDIQLQKEDMANKEKGMSTDLNRYARNFAMLKDERAAEIKTKMEMLVVTKEAIDNLKMKYKGDVDLLEYNRIAAGFDMQLAKEALEFNKRMITSNVQTQTRTVTNPAKVIDYKSAKEKVDYEEAEAGAKERDVNLFGKDVLKAYSKEEAKGLRDDIASYQGIMSMLDTMESIDKEYGFEMLPTEDAVALAKSLKADYLLVKKNLEKLGVLSESDKDIIDDLLANPTSSVFKTAIATIKNQQLQATSKLVNNLNTKTQVGKSNVTDEWLRKQVSPLAKQRTAVIMKNVLGNTTAPKQEETKSGWKVPTPNISK